MERRAIRIAAAVSLLGCAGNLAHAQAWLPPKGWASFTFTTGGSDIGNHLFSSTELGPGFENGTNEYDLGDIDTRLGSFGFQYGVSDRFAVGGDIAYVSSRYIGVSPENPAIDDGQWHGEMADVRAVARFQAYRGPVVLTPFLGALVPSHDYEHHGHTAIGKGLWEIPVGVSLGVPFGEHRAWSYLIGSYAYSFVEEVEGLNVDRSNALLEIGFFPTRGLALRFQGGWQNTHGGIDWLDLTAETFHFHDAAADADFWSAGAGLSYTVNDSIDLFVNWSGILEGANTHELSSWTTGVSWNIGPGDLGRRKIGGKYGPEEASRRRGDGARLARLSPQGMGSR